MSESNVEEIEVLPKIEGLTSEMCILYCIDGKRRVGYYHCNNYWYQVLPEGTKLLLEKVLSWEYL